MIPTSRQRGSQCHVRRDSEAAICDTRGAAGVRDETTKRRLGVLSGVELFLAYDGPFRLSEFEDLEDGRGRRAFDSTYMMRYGVLGVGKVRWFPLMQHNAAAAACTL